MGQGDGSDKLAIVLRHWMQHNAEHAREFGEWAEKAEKLGKRSAGEEIGRAAEQMTRANHFLAAALEKLEDE